MRDAMRTFTIEIAFVAEIGPESSSTCLLKSDRKTHSFSFSGVANAAWLRLQ